MFERNFLAKRFLSIPFVFLIPSTKNFRVFVIFSAENLEHNSVSSHPFRCRASESLFRRKTKFSI
ncbi:hypothetical protein A3I34_02775 [Candidatus Jorgensenbacteria bacterium RIFCSPLOWO2_02_FULL_45_12]|nr:MAG: hypothetical protein A3I34_02775 [Candidatus Jorgensenbacteria bacterium RIFCSPLOWO2_02_FULL_45_12]